MKLHSSTSPCSLPVALRKSSKFSKARGSLWKRWCSPSKATPSSMFMSMLNTTGTSGMRPGSRGMFRVRSSVPKVYFWLSKASSTAVRRSFRCSAKGRSSSMRLRRASRFTQCPTRCFMSRSLWPAAGRPTTRSVLPVSLCRSSSKVVSRVVTKLAPVRVATSLSPRTSSGGISRSMRSPRKVFCFGRGRSVGRSMRWSGPLNWLVQYCSMRACSGDLAMSMVARL